jgi:non-specific serine/threonine protein kinase
VAAPDLPAQFPPLPSLNAIPSNLPEQLTSFIGRERELAEAHRALEATRLLTLVGPGGTGKTRLALQLAAEELPGFPGGVWQLELAPFGDAPLVLPALAALLGLRELPGLPLVDLVLDYLRAKHVLLVLDNCEHLIEECARLTDQLLRACPHLRIVATSREALGIAGESVYRVPSLGLPETAELGPAALARCEAVQLFLDRAGAVQSGFALSERNAAAVAQICRRLDGIPLALELAAARVALLAPEQIASRLDDRFRLLTGGSRTALPRQQTLRALFDWSYDLLSESERALLRRVSVFAGGWTLESLEATWDGPDALELLGQLVNKSLVIVNTRAGSDEARYDLLETIRQYARDRLVEAGEATAARDRHLEYFVGLSEPAEAGRRSDALVDWLDRLERELENLRVALAWGLEQRPEAVLAIAGNMELFWVQRASTPAEGRAWLERALERVRALPPVEGAAARRRAQRTARGLTALGLIEFSLGKRAGSLAVLEQAVALARELGDETLLVYARGYQIGAYQQGGDDAAARAAAEECLALGRAQGEASPIVMSLLQLGALANREGDTPAASRYFAEARQLIRSRPLEIPLAHIAFYVMGLDARLRGDWPAARSFLEESAALMTRLGFNRLRIMTNSELAHIAREEGQLEAARAAYRRTIVQWQDAGNRGAVAHQLECFAFIARAEGQPERGARLLGAAEALRETAGVPMAVYERPEHTREVDALRAALGAAACDAARAQGRALTLEQAVAEAVEG